MPRHHFSPKAIADQQFYRLCHPKICYPTANDAAKALTAIKKHDRETQNNYSNANTNLQIYYNGDLQCYQIGHS